MPLANSEAIVAAALITAPATNTIVLVHRRQLMDHWLARLATFLDLPASGIGRIGGGWIRRLRPESACDQPVKLPEIVTAPTWHSGVSQGFRGRGRGFLHVQTVSSFRRPPTRNGSRGSGASRRSARTAACPASGRQEANLFLEPAGRDSRICSGKPAGQTDGARLAVPGRRRAPDTAVRMSVAGTNFW